MNLFSNFVKATLLIISVCIIAGCGGGSTDSSAQIRQNNYTGLFSSTTFHPRCANCHTFAEGGVSAGTHAGFSSNCASCHDQDDWRASATDMTTTNRTASEICNVAVQRRGSTDALATLLKTSPHVRWSIAEGDVPNGETLELAPPGDYATWLTMVDTWVAAGASCD